MTSATDELRRLLDEHGIDYQTHYLHAAWWAWSKMYDAVDNCDGTLTVANLTPEQAIAATLGSEREKALEELVQDWQVLYEDPDYGDCVRLRKRMQELGIEVIDE